MKKRIILLWRNEYTSWTIVMKIKKMLLHNGVKENNSLLLATLPRNYKNNQYLINKYEFIFPQWQRSTIYITNHHTQLHFTNQIITRFAIYNSFRK